MLGWRGDKAASCGVLPPTQPCDGRNVPTIEDSSVPWRISRSCHRCVAWISRGRSGACIRASETTARLSATQAAVSDTTPPASAATTSARGARSPSILEDATPSARRRRRASGSHPARRRSAARSAPAMACSVRWQQAQFRPARGVSQSGRGGTPSVRPGLGRSPARGPRGARRGRGRRRWARRSCRRWRQRRPGRTQQDRVAARRPRPRGRGDRPAARRAQRPRALAGQGSGGGELPGTVAWNPISLGSTPTCEVARPSGGRTSGSGWRPSSRRRRTGCRGHTRNLAKGWISGCRPVAWASQERGSDPLHEPSWPAPRRPQGRSSSLRCGRSTLTPCRSRPSWLAGSDPPKWVQAVRGQRSWDQEGAERASAAVDMSGLRPERDVALTARRRASRPPGGGDSYSRIVTSSITVSGTSSRRSSQ